MIDNLEGINDVNKLLDLLVQNFIEKIDGNYIPAIIEQGNIFSDTEDIDFYSKLILKKNDLDIKNTWLINNLVGVDIYNVSEKETYNLITRKNYNHNKLYELNPILSDEDLVWEKAPINDVHVNQLLENYDGYEEIPLFKYSKNELSEKNINQKILYLNKKVLENLVEFDNNSYYLQDYNICMEFELRYKNDFIKLEELKRKVSESEKLHGGFIEIYKNEHGAFGKKDNYKKTTVQGTISLNFKNMHFNASGLEKSIQVVNFSDNKIRNLNPSNYNDDKDAGLVVFDKKVIDFLKKEYIYTGTYLMPKRKKQSSLLVDELDDVVVFWEGEFNKFPNEIIKKIQKFNLNNRTTNIISEMMFDWQLNVNLNYLEKALPSQQLGNFTFENHQALAFEYGVNFWEANTTEELFKFLNDIEKIYDINPLDFNNISEDVNNLQKIYQKKDLLNDVDTKLLMQKYSFAILKELGVQ